jgi:hypothetical protein
VGGVLKGRIGVVVGWVGRALAPLAADSTGVAWVSSAAAGLAAG